MYCITIFGHFDWSCFEHELDLLILIYMYAHIPIASFIITL